MKKKIRASYVKSKYLSNKHLNYFDVYDDLLNRFIDKEIIFVEIGVLNGGSLFMWRDYFGKKARIIGIDLNPDVKKFEEDGFETFIGNQEDPNFWKSFFKKIGPVDIVLDDGGHTNKQQIITVLNTANNIKDGGKLVIEDTHTSYLEKFGNQSRYSFINFAKQIIDQVNYTFPFKKKKKFKNTLDKYVYGISFFESIVEFKINRKNCYENKYAKNRGHDSGVEDFRNHNSLIINFFKNFKNKTGLFKRIKLQKLNYLLENFRLKKYFD